MSESLKSGKCPKCGGNEIYTDSENNRFNERGIMMISMSKGFYVDTYLCLSCGYFEEYLKDSELKNEKFRNKVIEKWKRVPES